MERETRGMQKPRLGRGFLVEPKVGIEPTTCRLRTVPIQ
jgi:hypothetical protein